MTTPDVTHVVALCGRNAKLLEEMRRAFADEPRVRCEGFTNRMPAWLAAADALVHSSGGLTVLEALMSGCPAISYGWGRGRIRRMRCRTTGLGAVGREARAPSGHCCLGAR